MSETEASKASETVGKKAWAWRIYLLLGIFATGGYFLLPSATAQNVSNALIGLSAVAAMVVGLLVHYPSQPLPWYLFTAGMLMSATGDVVWTVYESVLQIEAPYPSVADALYIAGYLSIAAGLLLIGGRRGNRGRLDLVDPLIFATGVGMLSWTHRRLGRV